MRRISCLFLCLLPSQSLIPRTSASAAVYPVELKCSATGKPGAFSFNNEFYHQVGGVAMDSKMGPNYACLFVGFIEEQIGQQYTGAVPQLHKRYIDDVVGIACCNHVELEDYIAFVFNFHPALQFTHTISETELPFLDINLRISGDRIRTSIHYKATDTHSFLDYDSSHTPHCKGSLPYSQLLRFRCICSDQADFLDKAQEMTSFFERPGYSAQTLKRDLENLKNLKVMPFPKATQQTKRWPGFL